MSGGRREIVLWPAYFDASISRRLGRRLPRSLSVANPSPEEIARALEDLGLEYRVESAKYPRLWWKYDKRIVVEAGSMRKTAILRMVAERIVEHRRSGRKAFRP